MTRDEIRSVIRSVGGCGESNATMACVLPIGHPGPHGFESTTKTVRPGHHPPCPAILDGGPNVRADNEVTRATLRASRSR